MRSKTRAFTLIEVLLGILIVSIVMIAGFQALSLIGIWKIKLIERTNIEKQWFYSAEKFFELIKKGGSIDYEEYWNRKVVNTTNFNSGHYADITGYGNFGNWGIPGSTTYGWNTYFCVSWSGTSNILWSSGCLDNTTNALNSLWLNLNGQTQRYTQYEEHFIDRNSDFDTDGWDEDTDGNIFGDDDDLFLGDWPSALDSEIATELYLINNTGDERTYFRWRVVEDPSRPSSTSCDLTTNPQFPSGDGCLGTVEFLKMRGSDEWFDHSNIVTALWNNDGIIDTWRIDPGFTLDDSSPIAGTDSLNYWQRIFPDTIHVSELRFFVYPQKDNSLAWKDGSNSVQLQEYVGIQIVLQPSWKIRKQIQWELPTTRIRTHISLLNTDLE